MRFARPAALLLLLLAGRPAAAADEPKEPKKRPGRFKVGPLYLTPRLELKNAGVDGNVFYDRTQPVSDTSAVLTPSLEGALFVGHRLRLSGKGHTDLSYFRRRTSESSTDFGGEGSAEFDFGPFTFEGGGGGSQSRQRFEVDLDQRILRQDRWATGGAVLHLSKRSSLELVGLTQVTHYGSFVVSGQEIKDVLDRETLQGTARARYALSTKTTAVGVAEIIEDRFLSRVEPGRARSYRYQGGFELAPRAAISGTVLAGIREFPSNQAQAAPGYRGLVATANASVPLFQVARFALIARRDVYYAARGQFDSIDRLRNTYVDSRYRGQIEIDLPLSLLGRPYVEYGTTKSVLPVIVGGVTAGRRVDHLWTVGAGLLRRFSHSLHLGLGVSWSRRVSNISLLGYQRLEYGLQGDVAP